MELPNKKSLSRPFLMGETEALLPGYFGGYVAATPVRAKIKSQNRSHVNYLNAPVAPPLRGGKQGIRAKEYNGLRINRRGARVWFALTFIAALLGRRVDSRLFPV